MRARVPVVNGIGAFLLGPTLLVHGTEEQKARHLPPIASGQAAWAQGFSEPGSGSDLASLRTRAVRDGDFYVVDGQKVWTSLGQYADWLFVLVRTDPDAEKPHRGITFLLIEADAPGVTIRPIADIRGAVPFCEIFFEGVRVPVANRVGEENRGWYVAMSALGFERAGIGATIKYEQALAELVTYLRSPEGAGSRGTPRPFGRRSPAARRRSASCTTWPATRCRGRRRGRTGLRGVHQPAVRRRAAPAAGPHRRARFGRSAALWERENAPLNATFTHMRRDSVASTFLGGTTEIQRNVIATRA